MKHPRAERGIGVRMSESQTKLKLPRALESHPRAKDVEEALSRDSRALWVNGALSVSRVPFSEPLVVSLGAAMRSRALERGLEGIDVVLAGESKGLEAARIKQGLPVASRVSRVMVMANDGSERFYRHAESTLKKHGERVLGVVVDADSTLFAERLFGAGNQAKVVLVSDRAAVADLLLALIA